ncbi:GFA family protein [Sandarakinorhabdus sp. DWP1-3-1]|uniref:GFA family protein n=1 Tax=Sandarakinorhabdus sp. DWP1-3-1 TaxID=2804627 RepID=UPI003CF57AC7
MTGSRAAIAGGCLCGALRYAASAAPAMAGYCFCADCRKASGSGFMPFMNFDAAALRFSGAARQHVGRAARGTDSVRNFCPTCGGLVFGGIIGIDTDHTIYAGSLDDPAAFTPRIGIFARDRPAWVPLPPDITVFDTMPDRRTE